MTTPRYPLQGCSAGSQVRGDASSSDYAWCVNFNNGNVNNNHRDNNNAFVRAVRSVPAGEYQGDDGRDVSLRVLYDAWREARRGKKPSRNQLAFDARWTDGLLQLQRALNACTWEPRRSTCFIATRPKAREIHAPDFADRVVHHWLVPRIEAVFEPRFIHDNFANRTGKGSHAAVRRLQQFVRQVDSGQGAGWFLQLDVHNFFNSIHRATLWNILKPQLQKHRVSGPVMHATHALLRRAPLHAGVHLRGTPAERALVPPHKQLANAPKGCGLPIGNLSSQFFANVYLDALDQFVKHTLKARRYLRYVDDFVLVHHDREQLDAWRLQIEQFLAEQLRLSLKPDIRLRPLRDGIDFLGYIVRPTHTLVRRRVVAHARESFANWERTHVDAPKIHATPADLRSIQATAASYAGHIKHASSQRLEIALHKRFNWLATATRSRRFHHRLEGRELTFHIPRKPWLFRTFRSTSCSYRHATPERPAQPTLKLSQLPSMRMASCKT
jgi:RNA-directed DNA polymerase